MVTTVNLNNQLLFKANVIYYVIINYTLTTELYIEFILPTNKSPKGFLSISRILPHLLCLFFKHLIVDRICHLPIAAIPQ